MLWASSSGVAVRRKGAPFKGGRNLSHACNQNIGYNRGYESTQIKKGFYKMNSEQTSEKKIAINAVLKAIPLCRQVQAEMQGDAVQKADQSPVTVADFGAQALICRSISEAFPEDPIVAEEDSQALQENPQLMQHVTEYVNRFTEGSLSSQAVCDWIDRGSGTGENRFWTLDPIDGTKEFLKNGPYSIALALIVNGEVKLGVLGCPNLPQKWDDPQAQRGCLFVAERGKGASMFSLEGKFLKRIRVSRTILRLVDAPTATYHDCDAHRQIAHEIGLITPHIEMFGQAKYGVIARGEASVYIYLQKLTKQDYRDSIWEHAAGAIVVEEAGGVVTDVNGRVLDFSQGERLTHNRGILATNGELHPQLLACLHEWIEKTGYTF